MLDYLKALNQEVSERREAYQNERSIETSLKLSSQPLLAKNSTNLREVRARKQSPQPLTRLCIVPKQAVSF